MRFTLVAGLTLVCVSSVALGQSGSYTVTDAGAKLRAGPSEQFPDTATLRQGDPLLVDHEEPNGWLAVQDAPGKLYSVSWIQMQFVNFDKSKPLPQNVTVEEDTTLAAGQFGGAAPLTYFRRTKVPAGTILTAIGPKVTFEGKSWYPVVPPAGDFRYILKQQVRSDKTANTSSYTIRENTAAQLSGALPPTAIMPVGSSNIPPQPIATIPNIIGGPPTLPAGGLANASGSSNVPATIASSATSGQPVVQHPLWAQAEAAEKDGRLDDAEKLYFQLARLMNEPGGDHDIANMCYTRIHSLREKKRSSPSGTSTSAPRPVIGNAVQSINASAAPMVGLAPPPPPPPTSSNPRPGSIASGKLTRSALDIDGRRTYALEDTLGVTLVYVVAGQGMDLERYLNKRIDVYGSSSTRKDLSKPLVVASSAQTQ